MSRRSLSRLRISTVQRSASPVNLGIDGRAFDSDAARDSATAVLGLAGVDFGDGSGIDAGTISLDGTALLNRNSGTLRGSFQPPGIASVPSGTRAAFYIVIADSAGNASNIVAILIQF